MKLKKKKAKKTAKKPAKSPPVAKVATRNLAAKHIAQAGPEAPEPSRIMKSVRKAPGSPKRPSHKLAAVIPPILLEGDPPAVSTARGPGQRYALGPAAPAEHFTQIEDLGELPESYGTEHMFLAARDPHWLYASWDITREQQQKYNALSQDGHLIVRVYASSPEEPPVAEIHVHPESRNWFVPVGKAATKYVAELGFQARNGKWKRVALSQPTMTPPDSLSEDTSVQFATIPPNVSFEQLLELVASAVGENVPLVEAVQQLRSEGHPELPPMLPASTSEWTPAQAQALADVVSMDAVRRVWIGSLEVTELVRRQLQQEMSSAAAAQFSISSQPTSPGAGEAISGVSSPQGGVEHGARGFWFNVNAELVLYGATEPDAMVAIGGRPIRLRPDGTFSYRFALPDGEYDLPIKAVSADGLDRRSAELRFARRTQLHGAVGTHPQDAALKAPSAENVH